MNDINVVKKVMMEIAEESEKHVDKLAELDGLSGDGDLGETIHKCSLAVGKLCAEYQGDVVSDLFMKAGMAINKAAPSTLGTLLAGGVMNLAKENKGKAELSDEDVANIPLVMAAAIQKRGGAKLGDKTILDALIPMGEAVKAEYENSKDIRAAYNEGGKAAVKGAESTSGMTPKAGRAKWIGERVAENLDGGAVLCAKLAELFIK